MDEIITSVLLDTTPEKIYAAWMDTDTHSTLTGADAIIENKVGGAFTAFDEYISGRTLVLEPYKRIVQSWRTTEFSQKAPDSELEILLEDKEGKTLLTLHQRNIPPGDGAKYKAGWEEFYFEPMKVYF